MKKKYTLVGVDGNAFAVMGYVQRALRESGMRELQEEYTKEAMSGDYENLLCVSMDYIDRINESLAEC